MKVNALLVIIISCMFDFFAYPALCSDNVAAVINGEKVLERDLYSKYEETFAGMPLELMVLLRSKFSYTNFKEIYITDVLLIQEIQKRGLNELCNTNVGNVGGHAECIAGVILKEADKNEDGLAKLYREYQNFTGEKERYYLDVAVFGSKDSALKAYKIATTKNPRVLSEYGGFENRLMSSRQEIEKRENQYIVKGTSDVSLVDYEYDFDAVAKAASNAKANDIVGPLQAGSCFVVFSVTDRPAVSKATFEEFVGKVRKDRQKYLADVIMNKLWMEGIIESKSFGKNYRRKFGM